MNDTLEQCIRQIVNSMKAQVLQNVSFHSQADYIELSKEAQSREEKLPAVIMRGPILKVDNFFRELDDKIIKNSDSMSFTKVLAPKVYDVRFKLIVVTEGDIEGLETISKLISFFAINNQVTANGKIYNVELTKVPEDDMTSNISDLNSYKGEFIIEGIEFNSYDINNPSQSGKLVQDIKINIVNLKNGG